MTAGYAKDGTSCSNINVSLPLADEVQLQLTPQRLTGVYQVILEFQPMHANSFHVKFPFTPTGTDADPVSAAPRGVKLLPPLRLLVSLLVVLLEGLWKQHKQ